MLWFALGNLISRPVRTLLAWAGLSVAIAGMVGLFSVSAGIQQLIDKTFGNIPGLVALQPDAGIPLLSRIPTIWAEEIEAIAGVSVVVPEWWGRAHRIEGRPAISPPRLILGVDLSKEHRLRYSVYRQALREGRFLQESDRGTPVVLISRLLAQDYKKGVGDDLLVDGHHLRIAGIYETGSLFLDINLFMDAEYARRMTRQSPRYASAFYIEPDGSLPTETLAETIRIRFRGRRDMPIAREDGEGMWILASRFRFFQILWEILNNTSVLAEELAKDLPAPETDESLVVEAHASSLEDALEVKPAQQWGERIMEFSGDLHLFISLINIVGAVIAWLSILNTMLMSVSERLKEFGVLRANGWSRRDVLRLVLLESCCLGLLGGLAGCTLGWLGTLAANAAFPQRLHLSATGWVWLTGMTMSILLGMLGGMYPAWWAVKSSPMETIRHG
ncbi:MAG: hypothetical protein KatS3mg113_0753 [Planctomycetaceae bacterium]|nr:MAG: hypothetical protein KatS3mg113_0753 [Planctomycetaceae bacterium]